MELNRDKIIKALECCITNSEMDCINCPYRNIVNDLYDGCVNTLVKDALALINELTEENERLKHECDDCAGCIQCKCDCANIETDTVREMQERLKAKAKDNEWNGTICGDDIDQIAKEMLEGIE